jgi:hypothetical protein
MSENPRIEGAGAICWMFGAICLAVGLAAYAAGGWPGVAMSMLFIGLLALVTGER